MVHRELMDAEHWVRHCSRQRIIYDQLGNALGITYQAFVLRTERQETYLSGAHFEHVNGTTKDRLRELLRILRQTLKIGQNDGMAICNAGSVRRIGTSKSVLLRLRLTPNRWNAAYSKLSGLPVDNSNVELLEMLAASGVSELCIVKDV